MAKTFYTDRDIEELAKQGVTFLVVDEQVVLTDLARDKARRLGIELLTEGDRPSGSEAEGGMRLTGKAEPPAPRGADLETRVYTAVKNRLSDQVDESLLRAIVQRVIKSLEGR